MGNNKFFFSEDMIKTLDALPNYVLMIDEEHRILFANKAVLKDLNKDLSEIIDGYCPKIIHNKEGPVDECPLEDAVRLGKSVTKEFFDDHSKKWPSSSIFSTEMKTEDGKMIYFHTVNDITERIVAEQELKLSIKKITDIFSQSIRTITKIVEKRDPYTAGHQQNVSKLASLIAKELNIAKDQVEAVGVAGLLHDVGKIIVPIEILSRPGRITEDEMNIIRRHPHSGHNILKEIDFPWPVASIILQHHERLDGSGYPNMLLDKDISIEAKIISVADVVEAMFSHRPYRPAIGIDKALREITDNKGVLYDPEVVEATIRLFSNGFSFDKILNL
jgi:putative nucleotidyltransferase with HDIG domain